MRSFSLQSSLKNFILFKLIYNVILISPVQQSDSVIYIYIYFFYIICIIFHVPFHYGLLQNIEYSSVLYSRNMLFICSICNGLHVEFTFKWINIATQDNLHFGQYCFVRWLVSVCGQYILEAKNDIGWVILYVYQALSANWMNKSDYNFCVGVCILL